jgi:flagellar motor switch protein FliG
MFTFEDLVRLDLAALKKVLREVDSRALAVGLKSASDRLQAHLLSGLSKRAAESVQEEMGFLGKIKPKEIELAQMTIIETVRRLESAGEIELADEEGVSDA